MLQIRSYICLYSKGEFYDKVRNTDVAAVFTLMHYTIKKDPNHTTYNMVAMNAKLLLLQQANSVMDLVLVTTQWKQTMEKRNAATAICFNGFCEIVFADDLNAYKAFEFDTGNEVMFYDFKNCKC